MQVNNINSQQTFGTKCIIGNTSAQQGLKNYGENVSKGIYNAFRKLTKNEANDTFKLTLGSIDYDKPNTYINMSYFDKDNKLQSSMNFNMSGLKDYTTEMLATLVSGTYNMLKSSTFKVRNLTKLSAEAIENTTKQNIATINKLTKEFGIDEIH